GPATLPPGLRRNNARAGFGPITASPRRHANYLPCASGPIAGENHSHNCDILQMRNSVAARQGGRLMGSGRRARPTRLPEKLLRIRDAFGVTQERMVQMLEAEELAPRNYISNFEKGEREPPIPVLLKYARLARVCLEVLVDDHMDLPEHIPANPPYHPVPRGRPRKKP